MNRILAIVRKDACHLWPHAAVFLALLVLSAAFDPTGRSEALSALLPLTCWTLVIELIHQEKIPGDRQYWITRPIAWRDLLAAKALFLAFFVNLPLLLCHAAVLVAFGISPFAWIPVLLWRQVFFTAFYVLPVAALAAMTRSLTQVLLGAFAILAPLFLAQQFALSRGAGIRSAWAVTASVALVLAAGVGATLALLYSRRRTRLARFVAAGVGVATIGITFLPVDRLVTASGSAVRIELDPGRSAIWQNGGFRTADLEIPVRVGGLESDDQYIREGLTARVSGPGFVWRPSLSAGGLHNLANGEGWFNLYLNDELWQVGRNVPLDVDGGLTLTLFSASQSFPAPRQGRVSVPRLGVCERAADDLGRPSIVCYSPFPRTSLALGARNWIVPRGLAELGIPTDAGFQFLRRFTSQLPLPREPGGEPLIATPPAGRVKAQFDFRGVQAVQPRPF